jgi:hypothetical protein
MEKPELYTKRRNKEGKKKKSEKGTERKCNRKKKENFENEKKKSEGQICDGCKLNSQPRLSVNWWSLAV